MRKRIILLSIAGTFALGGCSNLVTPADDDYHFGDTTRTYCETTDPRLRDAGREAASVAGVRLFDLCRAIGIEFKEDIDG